MLRFVTQLVPSFAGAYAGGKLAESRGRVPMARFGLLVGATGIALFFLGGGALLWITLAVGTIGLGLYGPSHGAFTTELFPTEVRGTAGAFLTIAAVLGSASGLLLAGYLSKPLGGIGNSVAVLAIGPLFVATFLIRYLPEAKGKLLDEVSPSEV
jgi:MFS family permease